MRVIVLSEIDLPDSITQTNTIALRMSCNLHNLDFCGSDRLFIQNPIIALSLMLKQGINSKDSVNYLTLALEKIISAIESRLVNSQNISLLECNSREIKIITDETLISCLEEKLSEAEDNDYLALSCLLVEKSAELKLLLQQYYDQLEIKNDELTKTFTLVDKTTHALRTKEELTQKNNSLKKENLLLFSELKQSELSLHKLCQNQESIKIELNNKISELDGMQSKYQRFEKQVTDSNLRLRMLTKFASSLNRELYEVSRNYRKKITNATNMYKDSTRFDPDWYLEKNPDVKNSNMSPWTHYCLYGWIEGRKPYQGFLSYSFFSKLNDSTFETNLPVVPFEYI